MLKKDLQIGFRYHIQNRCAVGELVEIPEKRGEVKMRIFSKVSPETKPWIGKVFCREIECLTEGQGHTY